MSVQSIQRKLFVELSKKEQQLLTGGQELCDSNCDPTASDCALKDAIYDENKGQYIIAVGPNGLKYSDTSDTGCVS